MLVYQQVRVQDFRFLELGYVYWTDFALLTALQRENLILSITKYTKSRFRYFSEFFHEVKNKVSPHKPFPRK